MQQSQPLQIEQAPLSRDYFATNGPVEAAMLAVDPAKRQDDGHVADHVDHLAVNRRGPMRILMMQGLAAGSDAEHGDDNHARDQAQRRRHRQTDGDEQNDSREVATQGGNTLQTSMFSTVKAALEVAVMRLVKVPGKRSVK